ncbi:MAG: hypothetical protein Q9195_005430 [Heterodermia aff. obscurata]
MSAPNQGSSRKRVRWTAETQIFLLLHCMKPTKEIDAAAIAAMIPNATEKSVIEEIAKLIRKRKQLDEKVQAHLAAAAAGPAVAPADQPAEARASKAEQLKEGGKRKRGEDEDEDESDGETSSSEQEEEEEEEHAVVPPPRKRARAVKKAPAKRGSVAFITKEIIYDPD